MTIILYAVLMVFIMVAALAAHQAFVAVLTSGMLMAGVFVYRYQDDPVVREWLEKFF